MKKIVIMGEILVEIMADNLDLGFECPQALTGPFPSGAPAIFADQAAKLGQSVSMISSVGNDAFGRLNLERLQADGVDVSGVYIDPGRPTGSAFVRYMTGGSREFIFNIKHSASGHLHRTPSVEKQLQEAAHLHVMGSSLTSREFADLNIQAAKAVKERGGTVSFDPNLRKENLSAPEITETMGQILALTDLFLPSGEELTLLTKAEDEAQAISELLSLGVQAVVHKNGSQGASYHDAKGSVSTPSFPVEEVDPTGAGDCFGGAFTTFWLRGSPPADALTKAAAAGALAVTKRGPMEGSSNLAEIENFLEKAARAERKA